MVGDAQRLVGDRISFSLCISLLTLFSFPFLLAIPVFSPLSLLHSLLLSHSFLFSGDLSTLHYSLLLF